MLSLTGIVLVAMATVCVATVTKHDDHHVLVSVDCSIEHIDRGIGLDCQQATPPDFPQYINKEFITELKIRHKKIEKVKQTMFHDWKNLREVEITGCGVKYIDANAFQTLDKLEILNLEGVKYYDIDIDIESGRLNMSALDVVYNNQITYIPDDLFSKNTHLKSLTLRKNEIQGIQDGAFVNNKKLELLYLDRNKLKEITKQNLEGLESLTDLDLSFNVIESLPSETFYALTKLERLHLGGNPLKQLTSSHLQPFSNLKVLDVYRTQITVLPNNFPRTLEIIDFGNTNVMVVPDSLLQLPNLKRVGMRGNPWVCTYEVMAVNNWLWQKPNLVTEHDRDMSTCNSPEKLKGKRIDTLEDRDFEDELPSPPGPSTRLPSHPISRSSQGYKVSPSNPTQKTTTMEEIHIRPKTTVQGVLPRSESPKPPSTTMEEFRSQSKTSNPKPASLRPTKMPMLSSTEGVPEAPQGPEAHQAINTDDGNYHGLTVGTIIGILVAIAALCLVLGVIAYLWRQNHNWKVDRPHIYMKDAPPSDLRPVLQNSRYPYTGYTD